MFQKTWIQLLTVLAVIRLGQCARKIDAHIRARETRETIRLARDLNMLSGGLDGKRALEEEDVSVTELLQLTKGETMVPQKTSRTVQGNTLEKLQEEYEGIPVFDGQVTVETDPSGHLTGEASGYIFQGIDDDIPSTRSFLTEEETLELAIRAEGDELLKDKISSVHSKKRIFVDSENKAHVTDYIHYLIETEEVKKRPTFLVDTQNGEVLQRWNTLDTFNCGKQKTYKAYGGNEKMGKLKYGDSPYCLKMREEGDMCYLENDYVKIINMDNTEFSNITEVASFKCKNGYEDEVNGAFSPAIDAFFYGTLVGKMFEEWYNTTALKGKIVIRVHYANNYENAFWNGDNCTFGDGGSYLYPLTSLDVVGHEIAHGVTEQGSDLMYFDEMGGINEAFSDMVGEAAEEYLEQNDFKVGDDIVKSDVPMRDFKTPESDNVSISHVKDMHSETDPHYSSGVYRRVFYVAVKQKGMSVRDTVHVFLHANRMYWHPMASFEDCACGTLKASIDLGFSKTPFERAFLDVGITPCDISTHILGLVPNRTYSDITVSREVKPLFRFQTPAWADNVTIEASSAHGNIEIAIQNGTWSENDEGQAVDVIARGDSKVLVEDVEYAELFIQLSTTGNGVLSDVSLIAGYECAMNFTTVDYMMNMIYRYYCFGELE